MLIILDILYDELNKDAAKTVYLIILIRKIKLWSFRNSILEVRAWEISEDLELGEFDVIYEGTSLKESVSIAMDAVDWDKVVHAEVYTDCDDFLFCAKYETNEELEYF